MLLTSYFRFFFLQIHKFSEESTNKPFTYSNFESNGKSKPSDKLMKYLQENKVKNLSFKLPDDFKSMSAKEQLNLLKLRTEKTATKTN